MFMAMQAASYKLSGNWRIAFLLPSLLAALGTLFLIYDFGRRQWNHRVGLWAGVAVLTTFQFAYQSKRAQIDPLVTFHHARELRLAASFPAGPDWRAYWIGCFAAGSASSAGCRRTRPAMFLPYLFALAKVGEPAAFRRRRARLARRRTGIRAAVALWIVPMVITVRGSGSAEYAAYLQDILFRQTAARYTWDHHQPAQYFLGVIVFGWLPLTIALVGVLPRWVERIRARDARFLLPLAWVVLIILFFSFPSGKRDVYILPALPWVALLTAPYLDDLVQRAWFRWLLFALTAALALVFLGAGIGAWNGMIPRANDLVERARRCSTAYGFLVAVGAVAIFGRAVRVRRSVIGIGG
jgi:4-amino-4-deoxy-L-arabinose transferase-like glycosyltransferase